MDLFLNAAYSTYKVAYFLFPLYLTFTPKIFLLADSQKEWNQQENS